MDNTYALGLPPEYGASFMPGSSTDNCITSTLQIQAIEQTNNSHIQCAVGINLSLNRNYFSSAAHLLVQGKVTILRDVTKKCWQSGPRKFGLHVLMLIAPL